MANAKKGIKRIVWILSVAASIAAWIILFSNADLSPQKKTNQVGIAFINWLDRHYFEDVSGIKLSEFSKYSTEDEGVKFERIISIIDASVKIDSLLRWPFIWELRLQTPKTVERFNAYDARRLLWQDRLREALRLNENEIQKTFPDIDIKGFIQRYGDDKEATSPITEISGVEKYFRPAPESYFNITYHRPYGRIISLILLGFIPFIVIWLLWFLAQWVISGFKN